MCAEAEYLGQALRRRKKNATFSFPSPDRLPIPSSLRLFPPSFSMCSPSTFSPKKNTNCPSPCISDYFKSSITIELPVIIASLPSKPSQPSLRKGCATTMREKFKPSYNREIAETDEFVPGVAGMQTMGISHLNKVLGKLSQHVEFQNLSFC